MSPSLQTLDPRYSFPFTRVALHYNRVSNQPINQCFQINNPEGNIDYLKGELKEFTDAYHDYKAGRDTFEHAKEELGDTLVTAIVTGESIGINTNEAMLQSLKKIQKRLDYVQKQAPTSKPLTPKTFKDYWEDAKEALEGASRKTQ
ncbi:MAG: hypothetical protein K0Q50_1858 [Vampirovibrio sp.]|jgi:NTP pyrophosphatase (non-canonical NTP hydrolase)|nr:hypothetical protein [Vampirovibrio sp.]